MLEDDFKYADPTTGEYGKPTKVKLTSFIKKEQDKDWEFVESEANLPESPILEVRSVVFPVDPPIQQRERKDQSHRSHLGHLNQFLWKSLLQRNS